MVTQLFDFKLLFKQCCHVVHTVLYEGYFLLFFKLNNACKSITKRQSNRKVGEDMIGVS